MVAVCSVFFASWYSNEELKFQWIKRSFGFLETKNWQIRDYASTTNGGWWAVATPFSEGEWNPFVWPTNCSLTWPLFIARWWICSSSGKCASWTVYGYRRIDQSEETDGWLYAGKYGFLSDLSQVSPFQENSCLLEQVVETARPSYWWAQPQGSIDLCLEDTLTNAPHDGICGCGVDVRRWKFVLPRSNQVRNFVKTNLLNEWKGKLADSKSSSEHLFTVINARIAQ